MAPAVQLLVPVTTYARGLKTRIPSGGAPPDTDYLILIAILEIVHLCWTFCLLWFYPEYSG